MKAIRYLPVLLLLSIAAPMAPLSAQASTAAADTAYTRGQQTRDGTGKYYMGREISLVMGHLGASWLERATREREERTDLFIDRLPVDADDVVADIGAGTGYFSFPIAERLTAGRMLAVDIQPEMLAIVEQKKREMGVDNVETIRGTIMDPGLPPGEVDLIYIVDAYHEFSHPKEMARGMLNGLKPGGHLVLLEYRAEDPTVPIKTLHKMSEEQAIREMEFIGFEWVRTEDFLPQQHMPVFRKPG